MNEEKIGVVQNIYLVPVHQVVHVWRECHEMVQDAIDKNPPPHHYDHWDFLQMCIAGEAQLWVYYDDGIKLVKVTRVSHYNKFKSLVDMITSGHGALGSGAFHEMQEEIEVFAEKVGCKYIEGYGRAGWEKIGKELGYTRTCTVMTKEL